MSLIIILRLTATGSQELQYVPSCRGSETQYFSFFPPFENTAWEWSRHLEAHEYIWGTEEVQGGREGSENESWGRGFTLQLNQANRSLLPKKGRPHFHLSFIPYLSLLAKQISPLLSGSSDMNLNLVNRFSSLSQEKTIHFFYCFGQVSFLKAEKLFPQGKAYGHRARSKAWLPLLGGANG